MRIQAFIQVIIALLGMLFSTQGLSDTEIDCVRKNLDTYVEKGSLMKGYKLTKLGKVESKYNVFLYEYSFGNENNRRTALKVIVTNGDLDFLGLYDIPDYPLKIENGKLMFYEVNIGDQNQINFNSQTLPSSISIDGEYYSFVSKNVL